MRPRPSDSKCLESKNRYMAVVFAPGQIFIVQNQSCRQIDLQTLEIDLFSQESVLHACLQDSFSIFCKQLTDKTHRLASN